MTCAYLAVHDWDSEFQVGSHHIARHVARKQPVLYAPRPISLNSMTSSIRGLSRIRHLANPITSVAPQIRQLRYGMPVSPSNRWPLNSSFWFENTGALLPHDLESRLATAGFAQPDLLVTDTLYQTRLARLIQPKTHVVRIADNPRGFPGYNPALERQAKILLDQADFVLCPTRQVLEYCESLSRSRTVLTPNGIDLDYVRASRPKPEFLGNSEKPKALYCGSLGPWLDLKLLSEIAEKRRDIDFYVIGPASRQQRRRYAKSRLQLLGSKQYTDALACMEHCDIGLVPFDTRNFQPLVEAIDALKLYEYLAKGMSVVAAEWPQSKAMSSMVQTAGTNVDDWCDALDVALNSGPPTITESTFHEWSWSARLSDFDRMVESRT